jgi:ketosteroid isomerase-like protein
VSEQNVDLILAAFDAYNAGDLDALMEFWAPDIEAIPDASVFVDAGVLYGREQYRAWVEGTDNPWTEVHRETTEVLVVGACKVLYRGDWVGEGAVSGLVMRTSITDLITVRGGLISRVEYFFDHDKALKAAGLVE